MNDPARRAALDCVLAVEVDGAYANVAMPGILRQARLGRREAAFATELAYGTLRMSGLYDVVIAHAANRRPASLEVAVATLVEELLGVGSPTVTPAGKARRCQLAEHV